MTALMRFRLIVACLLISQSYYYAAALSFQLPNFFGAKTAASTAAGPKVKASTEQQKKAILDAVSFTNNGKTATTEQQADVLRKVRALETSQPPDTDLLENPEKAKILDGVWYLQYTSPSVVREDSRSSDDEFPDDSWKPNYASEGDSNIETRQFNARGSVSAAGVTVDTSNRIVKQIIDVEASKVINEVNLDWGKVLVSGPFRPSSRVPNRAIVSFDTAKITAGSVTVNLGFVFAILAVLRGSKDNGWLETTFVDQTMRIGRGNKGTMFVLTRAADAVQP